MAKRLIRVGLIILMSFPFSLIFIFLNKLSLSSKFWLSALIFSTIWIFFFSSLKTINQKSFKVSYSDSLFFYFITWSLILVLFTKTLQIPLLILIIFLFYSWSCLVKKLDKEIVKVIVSTFIFFGVVEVLFGISQLYNIIPNNNSYFKITGHFQNPDHFAGFILSIAPLTLGVCLFHKSLKSKTLIRLSFIYNVLVLIILPSTKIRSAWLAILVGSLFLLYHRFDIKFYLTKYINTIPKKTVAIVTIFSLIISGSIALYKMKPDSAFGRLLIWKVTIDLIQEKPLFGHGINQFKTKYNLAQAEYFTLNDGTERERLVAGNVEHAHNEYLQIWMELGLVGLILFFFLMGSILFPLNRKKSEESEIDFKYVISISAKASIISILVISFFSFPFHVIPTLINFIFLLALVNGLKDGVKIYHLSAIQQKIIKVLVIVVLCIILYLSFDMYNKHKSWENARKEYYSGNKLFSLEKMETLFPTLKNNGHFLFDYSAFLVADEKYEEAMEVMEKAKKHTSNPNLYMLLGEANEKLGKIDEAVANYRISSNIIPHKLFPLYRIMKAYIKKGDHLKAVTIAKQLIDKEEKIKTFAGKQIKSEALEYLRKRDVVLD